MNCLFNVSRYVSLPIFCEWIDVKDLCTIDTALCNESLRGLFLNLIQHENVKFEGLLESTSVERYLLWLLLRGLHIIHLNVKKTVMKDIQIECVSCLTELKILRVEQDSHRYRSGFIVLIEKCPNLQELYLSDCRLLNDKVVFAIGKYCKNLTKVYFPCNTKAQEIVTNNSVISMAKECTLLQSVYIASFLNLTDKAIMAFVENCPDIVEFSIIDMPLLTDNVLFRVAEKLRKLTYLDISDCIDFTGAGVTAVLRSCENLEQLLIEYTLDVKFSKHSYKMNIDWAALPSLHSMRSMRLTSHLIRGEDYYPALAAVCNNSPSLTKLILFNCQSDLLPLAKCIFITDLDISSNYRVEDSFLAQIVETNKCLRILNVSCTKISAAGLVTFTAQCPQLTELYMQSLFNLCVSDELLQSILDNCSQLRELDVSGNQIGNPPSQNIVNTISTVVQSVFNWNRDADKLEAITLSAVKPGTSLRKLTLILPQLYHQRKRICKENVERVRQIESLEFVCNL